MTIAIQSTTYLSVLPSGFVDAVLKRQSALNYGESTGDRK